MNIISALNDTYTLIFAITMAVFFVVLIVYYGLFYYRLGRKKKVGEGGTADFSDAKLPSVSVVITVHNDAPLLKDNLIYLLEQDYPNYEVVVVNYLSQDDTPYVLKVLGANYPNMKVVNFSQDVNMFKGRKYPLSIGIRTAKNDVILLTEPDAKPKSFTWIREMVKGYMKGVDIVGGYCSVGEGKGLLGKLVAYDNMENTASMVGMSMMGNPYTATGRNLSYKRHFFMERKGFIRHYSIPEGADDMFVNQNANRRNFAFVLHPDAWVETVAAETTSQWYRQRKARYATKKYYSGSLKLALLMHPVSLLLFYAALAMMLVVNIATWPIAVGFFVAKTAWHIVAFSKLNQCFEVKKLCWLAPLFEFYFLFLNTIFYLLALPNKKRISGISE